ncbi:crossover junction endodeoxyribonuclease RuvC [Candidatus Woesebacteria bacterium]|nr:crossover junction endodeoxyribonuclease RuvC [Candidatus Woesebacteria bacterium]
MRILACDSGVERTGYAVLDTDKKNVFLTEYNCIFTHKSKPLTKRLEELSIKLNELIEQYSPEIIVIEKLFFTNNQTTGIMVAQAQGVLLMLAGKYDIKVEFLTPTQIKHTVTGYGKSDKKGIQKMLRLLLNLETDPQPDDVTDAIACGYAYCTINKLI